MINFTERARVIVCGVDPLRKRLEADAEAAVAKALRQLAADAYEDAATHLVEMADVRAAIDMTRNIVQRQADYTEERVLRQAAAVMRSKAAEFLKASSK